MGGAHLAVTACGPVERGTDQFQESAFLVPSMRNTYAWVMPASRAMVSTDAPCSPWSANSGSHVG